MRWRVDIPALNARLGVLVTGTTYVEMTGDCGAPG